MWGNPLAALFRRHEEAFLTQYAEVRERSRLAGPLLPGTAGHLKVRNGSGPGYWYRVYYFPPGTQREELVGKESDAAALAAARDRIAFSDWVAEQVSALRRLGFQVADKTTARVLVELHNAGAFQAGLALVGTLAHMAWLNELGAVAVSARTLDIDLARGRRLALGAPLSLMETLQRTGLQFTATPGLSPGAPATSAKLPGAEGLRVDLLVPGARIGEAIAVPELGWSAQAIPYFDYLLRDPVDAVVLAGWHCIPIRIPQAARLVLHKLYSSVKRTDAAKRPKDFEQATVLAAALMESDPTALRRAMEAAPAGMITPIRPLLPRLRTRLASHPEAAAFFERTLAGSKARGRTRTDRA